MRSRLPFPSGDRRLPPITAHLATVSSLASRTHAKYVHHYSHVFRVSCFAFRALPVSPVSANGNAKDRTVTVMTRNLDAGSDSSYVLQAALDPNTTQIQLLTAIRGTFQDLIASNIPG